MEMIYLHAFQVVEKEVFLSSAILEHKESGNYHQRPSSADRKMVAGYKASEISMIEQEMGGDRAVAI